MTALVCARVSHVSGWKSFIVKRPNKLNCQHYLVDGVQVRRNSFTQNALEE